MAHEMKGCIRYSETGADGKLTLEGLINYYQDCSFGQSESIGYGIEYLRNAHKAWLVSSWQVCINRMPRLKEDVVVKTWPFAFKGFFGYRNFTMETADGEMLAYANSLWIYVDTETGKPARAPEDEMEAYGLEEEYPMERDNRKLKISDEMESFDPVVVPSFFIDTNNHMNNGKYVMLAQQYVSNAVQVKEIRVEYRKAAVLGDTIYPKVHTSEEEKKTTVVLEAEDGKPYCVVCFSYS